MTYNLSIIIAVILPAAGMLIAIAAAEVASRFIHGGE